MATGHGGGGRPSRESNHPALASASAAPPYPRRGVILLTTFTRSTDSLRSSTARSLANVLFHAC